MESNKNSGWVMVGAVTAAVGASLCCTLPIAVSLIGIGLFTGASAFFEGLRPYFLAAAGIFLAVGYYFAFRRRPAEICACEPGTVGSAPPPPASDSRTPFRVALIVATVAVLFFSAVPNLLTARHSSTAVQTVNTQKVAVMRVEGMTCRGCVTAVEKALQNVPGVMYAQVSLQAKEARVGVDMSANVTEAMFTAAVDKAGYRAFSFRWEAQNGAR